MWKISKRFDFCYAHRVHNQSLDETLSLGSGCKCRHWHGHQGAYTISVSGEYLENGMVIDFKNLSFVKDIIDTYLDHKTIVDQNDPVLSLMLSEDILTDDLMTNSVFYDGTNLNISVIDKLSSPSADDFSPKSTVLNEYLDSFVFVDYVPTSENLAQWMYGVIMRILYKYFPERKFDVEVEFSETPKTSAIYNGPV